MTYTWTKEPKPINELVKLFRNFSADEFNSDTVCESWPNFKEWDTTTVMTWIEENCSKEVFDSFYFIYRKKLEERSMFPMAYAIGDYLKKYDTVWYKNNVEANHKKLNDSLE